MALVHKWWPWVDMGVENIGHKLVRSLCPHCLPARSLVTLWASLLHHIRFTLLIWLHSHPRWTCPGRTCSPVWWLPLKCPVDGACGSPLWHQSLSGSYPALRSEPINQLHWNHICIRVRELPWRILIRGDTFRASSTILLHIPFQTWLGSVTQYK